MTTTLMTTKKILDEAVQWTIVKPGYLTALYYSATGDSMTLDVSEVELNVLHPQLSASIKGTLAFYDKEYGVPTAPGTCTKHTLALLDGKVIVLAGFKEKPQYFTEIRAFIQTDLIPSCMVVMGNRLVVDTYDVAGTLVPYVAVQGQGMRNVLRSDLDQKYPEWETRLTIAEQLDLTKPEAAEYALGKKLSMVIAQSTDGIDFV